MVSCATDMQGLVNNQEPRCYCGSEHIPCVQRVPLFAGIPAEELQGVVRLIQHRDYKAGERIFHADESFNSLIIVRYGQVKLSRLMSNGEEIIVNILNEGDVYGGDQLFASSHSREDAYAMGKTGLCYLSQKELEGLLRERPELSLRLIRYLSNQVNQERTLLEVISYKNAELRVAAYLLSVYDRSQDPVVAMRQEDIASTIHLTAETVNRKLQSLQRDKLIRISGHRHIEIMRPDALRARLA